MAASSAGGPTAGEISPSPAVPGPGSAVVVPVPRRGAPRRVRRYLRGLDHIGLVFALLAFSCSLTPSLLPRSWPAQGAVAGLAATAAYAIGVLLTQVGRWAGIPALPPAADRRIRRGIIAVGAAVVGVLLWFASTWQIEVRRAVGMPPSGRYLYLGVLVVSAAVFVLLVGIARLFADLYRMVLRRLVRRLVPQVVARLIAATAVAVVAVTLLNGALYDGFLAVANTISAKADARTEASAVRPSSSMRSGGPGSLVEWGDLGREGRDFVSSGPTPAQIQTLTHHHAMVPIRAYAGLRSASTLQGQAQVVLAELKRTGAFQRALLGVATTTGTGWVDPTLADPLEYMYDGDTALASMQYSYLPSWISFVADQDRAREAGRTLFDVIYDYWATLPVQTRPRLVVFGESLGTFGGTAAFSGVSDLVNRTQGALFIGPPNSTDLWAELTDHRIAGSPERLPLYGNDQTVRFAATSSDLRAPDGALRRPRIVFVQHASDPIVWWSPALVWSEPDWLREPRGQDVLPQVHWFPLVTFWQITSDMTIALDPPPGHGHHYGAEVPTAWAAILHPPHWTDAETAALGPTP